MTCCSAVYNVYNCTYVIYLCDLILYTGVVYVLSHKVKFNVFGNLKQKLYFHFMMLDKQREVGMTFLIF